ncbi:MAG: membrane protein insertion efficiency factor YidD [Ruminococcus callidus]
MRYLAAALIRLYQKFSRLTPAVCRFYPTCSCYAQTAILRFGVLRGGFLALRRLLHCHPWNPGGIDYVPEHLDPPREVFGRYVRNTTQQKGLNNFMSDFYMICAESRSAGSCV